MYRSIIALLWFSACAAAQYTVSAYNAAGSFAPLAPGALAVIQLNSDPNQPGLPSLDSKSVTVQLRGGAVPVLGPGPNPASVLVRIPTDSPSGEAELKLTADRIGAASGKVTILDSAIGIYDGTLQNIASGSVERNALTRPARPGQAVTIWGTGLGPAKGVTVFIGGLPAAVSYAGPAPGIAGADQINVRVPDDPALPESCYVAVEVRALGWVSNQARLSISRTGSVCDHPFGLSAAALRALDNGGTAPAGIVDINTAVLPPGPGSSGYIRTDNASAIFQSFDADGFRLLAPPVTVAPIDGECQASAGTAGAFLFAREFLDVGPYLRLRRGGTAVELRPDAIGSRYATQLPASDPVLNPDWAPGTTFEAGQWVVQIAGSTKVLPTEAEVTLPGAIRITNFDELQSIDASADLTVRWESTAFTKDHVVYLSLGREGSAPGVSCRAPAAAGSLTIPADLTRQFTSVQPTGAQVRIDVHVTRRADRQDRFAIPLRDGGSVPAVVRPTSLEYFTGTIHRVAAAPVSTTSFGHNPAF